MSDMQHILIIGATSAIAEQTARKFAEAGAKLFLVARNPDKLGPVAADLRLRGASEVKECVVDLLDFDQHPRVVQEAWESWDGIDAVLIAHGTLDDQEACQGSFDEAKKALDSNFLSAASLCTEIANRMEAQKSGTLAVISSVAGDRGRQSNYVYGAAKAGLDSFLSGLRNRLFQSGVHVVTIKPGFVDTPMTAEIEKGPLFASAEKVGGGIYKAMQKKRNVVYLPWFWWGIMTIIRNVPETIFKRLKL